MRHAALGLQIAGVARDIYLSQSMVELMPPAWQSLLCPAPANPPLPPHCHMQARRCTWPRRQRGATRWKMTPFSMPFMTPSSRRGGPPFLPSPPSRASGPRDGGCTQAVGMPLAHRRCHQWREQLRISLLRISPFTHAAGGCHAHSHPLTQRQAILGPTPRHPTQPELPLIHPSVSTPALQGRAPHDQRLP